MSRSGIAHHIIDVCRSLHKNGFVSALDGNVSARLPNGNFLTTPTSVNKGRVRVSDLVEVDRDGVPVRRGRIPSMEIGMHLFIYKKRPEVRAVVHAHPPYATGFATAHVPLDQPLFPEVISGVGPIPLASFAAPWTSEVAASIAPYVKSATAILLMNHGVVTYGKDLDEAYFRMEKVEHAAHVVLIARLLGGEKPLTTKQVQKLRLVFSKKRIE
jgi:L-fuculose-phosphate aldolase